MKLKHIGIVCCLIVMLGLAGGTLLGQQDCGGASIANGPFTYAATGATSATFSGTGGSSVNTGFTVTAPNTTGSPVVFPGQGQNACLGQADATIGVLQIIQVGDASGNLLDTPIDVGQTNPTLFNTIANAFLVVPGTNTFTPGSSVNVNVTVSNPSVASTYYGVYVVKVAAQAPGAGIGVGTGFQFTLSLFSGCSTDTTKPVVTIIAPTSADKILGGIAVDVQAYDPDDGCGSGLASLTVTVSSAGETVKDLPISLTLDHTLSVPAGVTVEGTGTFTPTGGSGTTGTTSGSAFTGTSRSGIGTYTLTATATDVAGNTQTATVTFKVKYNVSFTTALATGCGSSSAACGAQYAFTANRANPPDGAFMYDQTVVVKLVHSSTEVASHSFSSTGSINTYVKINTTVPDYETNFQLPAGTKGTGGYEADVYFQDVDGNLMLQASDTTVSF